METRFIFRVSVRLSVAYKRQGTIAEKGESEGFHSIGKTNQYPFISAQLAKYVSQILLQVLSYHCLVIVRMRNQETFETILYCRQFSSCPVVNSCLVTGLLHLTMVETA